jgi:carbon-monoxide dehydrogenase large subunit
MKDGKITGLKVKTIADHGYSDAPPTPRSSRPLFNVITGSYDSRRVRRGRRVYTNKPPGGVAAARSG